jgi:hypothetical protein
MFYGQTKVKYNFIMKYKYKIHDVDFKIKQVKIMLWNLNTCNMGIIITRMLDLKGFQQIKSPIFQYLCSTYHK